MMFKTYLHTSFIHDYEKQAQNTHNAMFEIWSFELDSAWLNPLQTLKFSDVQIDTLIKRLHFKQIGELKFQVDVFV